MIKEHIILNNLLRAQILFENIFEFKVDKCLFSGLVTKIRGKSKIK